MLTASTYPVACLTCDNRDAWPVSVSSGHGHLVIRLRCRTCHHEWTHQTEAQNAVTPAPPERTPMGAGSKMPS